MPGQYFLDKDLIRGVERLKQLKYGLHLASQLGAEYADLQRVEIDEKRVQIISNRVIGLNTSSSRGISVRLLAKGRWGTASGPAEGKDVVRALMDSAWKMASSLPELPQGVHMGDSAPAQGEWQAPCAIDPFALPDSELIQLLKAADGEMNIEGISQRVSTLYFRREKRRYINSDGTCTEQIFNYTGGGLQAWAQEQGQIQQRSWPFPGGSYAGRGFEYIQELEFPDNARRIAREAVSLTQAPPCPEGVVDLILTQGQLAMQLQRTCGNRAQLDQPGCFPTEKLGEIRFGSPVLTVLADATLPGAAGSFAYDQEGVEAQSFALVQNGKVVDYLSGRQQATAIGRNSTGAMRSVGWLPPSPSVTNLVLQPGEGSLEDLVQGIERGLLLDTPRSFSIDPELHGFVAQAEMGWLVEDGKISGMVRHPIYSGYPTAFWSGCDAIAGSQAQQELGFWDQGLIVGHRMVPLRIRGVKVGSFHEN